MNIYDIITTERRNLPRWESDSEEFCGYKVTCEERYGGSEGDGEEHYVVLKFELDGVEQYWLIPGFYQSYEGSSLEYSDAYKVEPYEETVRDWRKID